MSINEVRLTGGGFDLYESGIESDSDINKINDVFNLKFEPASFGGKDFNSEHSTSIFDDWDS